MNQSISQIIYRVSVIVLILITVAFFMMIKLAKQTRLNLHLDVSQKSAFQEILIDVLNVGRQRRI